jgi:threonine/homoserine/homoserine lactone efflux protein
MIGRLLLGIGTLLQASAGALTVLRLAGGAYLVWLGIRPWGAPALRFNRACGGMFIGIGIGIGVAWPLTK